MKILVTGANGYLGQGVVKQLLDDGQQVIAADFSMAYVDPRAKRMECDLFSVSNPYEYFDRPDVVLHMAWRNGFVHNSISHIDDLPNHYKFIKEMATAGVKQIAVLGTMHEVGFYEGSINENTPTHPQSLYGISKNALRDSAFLIAKETGAVIQWIRGYYIVGNTEFGCSIFSKIAAAEKEGKTEFPFTTGQNQWDFIDYGDFCYQVASIVEQNEVNGIINACSGHPEKLATRVEQFIKDNNFKIKLAYGKFKDRPYDSKAVWGNDEKINRILSLKADRNRG